MPTVRKSLANVVVFLTAVLFTSLLTLGVLVYHYRDIVFKTAIEFAITEATGFRTEIQTLQHEWPAVFTMRGVKMYNPGGYTRKLFARAPYFYIELDMKDILERRSFHIRQWSLIITELHLEKSKEGITNGSILKSIKKLGGGGDGQGGQGLGFLMDRLEVKIVRITYEDRTGVLPKKITTRLRLPASVYENVTSFKAMVDEIRAKVMELAGPAKIVMLSPFVLEGSLKKAAETPGKVAETPMIMKTGEILKTTAVGAKDKLVEVAEVTKDQIGGLMRLGPISAATPQPEPSPYPGPEVPGPKPS
jgi:hypothetical protein